MRALASPTPLLPYFWRLACSVPGMRYRYVSALGLLCRPEGCVVRDPRAGPGEFFYFDQEHLTVQGSIHFAKLVAAQVKH